MSALREAKDGRDQRGRLTPEAREVARATMHQRGVFNRYLKALGTVGRNPAPAVSSTHKVPRVPAQISSSLRSEFLSILPSYARRNGFDRRLLLDVGVPAEDLDEVAIFE